MGWGVIEIADQVGKWQRKADGFDVGDADIGRLNGPPANALIAVFGAMGRRGAMGGTGCRVLAVRGVTSLGRTA